MREVHHGLIVDLRNASNLMAQQCGRLIDFLLSEQVERLLAESVSHNVPIRPGLAASYPQYAVPDPLDIDYRRAAGAMDRAVSEGMRSLDRKPDAP